MVSLKEIPKTAYDKGDIPSYRQCASPSSELLLTHASTGGPPAPAVVLAQFLVEPMLLPSGSLCTQGFVCALWVWSLCFPQSCGSPVIKSCWASRSDSLGIHSPFVGSPGWGAWCGVPNLHNSGRTSLSLLFFSLWVTHPAGLGFDFIVIMPLLPSHWSFFFVFGHGYLFLVDSCILLSLFVQQLVVILVLSQEEMSTHPSTLPSWTRTPLFFIFWD